MRVAVSGRERIEVELHGGAKDDNLVLQEKLTPYGMVAILRMVDISQGMYSAQKFVIDMIAKNGGIDDSGILPAECKGICASFLAAVFDTA